MDLYFKPHAAQIAIIRVIFVLGAIALTGASAVNADSAQRSSDYLYLSESKSKTTPLTPAVQNVTTHPGELSSTSYRAFDGQVYTLQEHHGRYVTLLVPGEKTFSPSFTADHLQEMIDRLDLLYALYVEILHTEPRGSGPIPIAFVTQTCGVGCGLLGDRGIEITATPEVYQGIIEGLNAGHLDALLIHEMAHNFDVWSSYLHYLPDHAHAWTDLMEYFVPYRYSRDGTKTQTADELYQSPARNIWRSYVATESARWDNCVRDQACGDAGLSANHLWAMVYYRIEALNGLDALLGSFQFLKEYTRLYNPPQSALDKEGLRLLSLAVGSGANISCTMDQLNWSIPQTIRQEMFRLFGNGDALCADSDQDGFARVNGDCDDTDPDSHIHATEIAANERDDDCDGLVDEQSLIESELGNDADNFKDKTSTSLPSVIVGASADPEDSDSFSFAIPESRRTRITLCTEPGFRGWAAGLNADGSYLNSPTWYVYGSEPGCTSGTFDFMTDETGQVIMIPDQAAGSYSLTISAAPVVEPDLSAAFNIETNQLGGVSLHVHDGDGALTRLGTDQLEVWVSGIGTQMLLDFTPGMDIQLNRSTLPSLSSGGLYQARIRPRADGLPLAGFSDGQLFEFHARDTTPLTTDHRYSGAWFDPEHNGEGFIVEVLDNDRALVYWFTFLPDGRQRWLLGVGDIRDNQVTVAQMHDTQGGRFGSGFDPDEVEMRVAGSLSITFRDCTSALVNYNIDGSGGHQSTIRLSELQGHGCVDTGHAPSVDFSGSWYDPTHDGEGFVVQQLSDSEALVFWFTYDDSGNQSWFFNTGNINNNTLSFPILLQPVGGQFGRSYDPAQVTLHEWGTLSLELNCTRGRASFISNADGYSNGSQSLVALTRLQNSGCGD